MNPTPAPGQALSTMLNDILRHILRHQPCDAEHIADALNAKQARRAAEKAGQPSTARLVRDAITSLKARELIYRCTREKTDEGEAKYRLTRHGRALLDETHGTAICGGSNLAQPRRATSADAYTSQHYDGAELKTPPPRGTGSLQAYHLPSLMHGSRATPRRVAGS